MQIINVSPDSFINARAPLGFDSRNKIKTTPNGVESGDPAGNRTRDSAVRGLRLDRLTTGPCHLNSITKISTLFKC